jgi:hypothetical protein
MSANMLYIFAIICGVIILLLLLRYVLVDKFPYTSRRIMSEAELRFYRILEPLVPDNLRLSIKPRLGDIIDVDAVTQNKDSQWKGRYGAAIWSKHIDFVLFDPVDAEIVLCIELDDSSHLTPDAKTRDRFKDKALTAAEVPLLRIPAQRHYDAAVLRDLLSEQLD